MTVACRRNELQRYDEVQHWRVEAEVEMRGARGQEALAALSLLLVYSAHFRPRFAVLALPVGCTNRQQTRPTALDLSIYPVSSVVPSSPLASMATSPNLGDSVFSEYETDLETLTTSIADKLAKDARQQRGGALSSLRLCFVACWLTAFVLQRLVEHCSGG